jgi:hypothetical protein
MLTTTMTTLADVDDGRLVVIRPVGASMLLIAVEFDAASPPPHDHPHNSWWQRADVGSGRL